MRGSSTRARGRERPWCWRDEPPPISARIAAAETHRFPDAGHIPQRENAMLRRLLRGEQVSHEGTFYRVKNLKLLPQEPAGLSPWLFVSGGR